MTTTLLNCQILLSKELGDFWEGTTTTATGEITIVDTSLIAKPTDWITDVSYVMITSGSRNEEEVKISHDNSDLALGTLSIGTLTGSLLGSTTYQVHRVFEPSEKRRALIAASKNVFGNCYDLVWNEEMVSGNWLKDGSFERWDSGGTSLTDWAEDVIAGTRTSTSGYYKHGTYSACLAGTIGTISQGITEFDDLKFLAGKSVTFSVQGWCSTASCLRLSIDDGTTETFSSYHSGGTSWTENSQPLEVQAMIDATPTEVEFRISQEIVGTSFVDDARVISGYRSRLYIGHLNLAQNRPNEICIEPANYSQEEPWLEIKDWEVDNGYLYLPTSVSNDYRLRIIGKQYLDFLSSGTTSTSWSSTINLDHPQTEILVAEAAVYLYTWMSMPNYESGTREDYQGMLGYWKEEARARKGKFGMPALPVTVSWGHE